MIYLSVNFDLINCIDSCFLDMIVSLIHKVIYLSVNFDFIVFHKYVYCGVFSLLCTISNDCSNIRHKVPITGMYLPCGCLYLNICSGLCLILCTVILILL